MTYKVLDKIPRKYDFTKNRWPSADYEKYEDEQLNSKTVEINEDTKNLNKKYDEYCKFIKIIEPIAKKKESYYEEYSSFVKENFKRTSTQEKIKAIFRESFLQKLDEVCLIFIQSTRAILLIHLIRLNKVFMLIWMELN